MIDQLRSGLVSIGRAFTRTDTSALRQAWVGGRDVDDVRGTRLGDPYTGHGLIFRCVNLIGMACAAVPFEILDVETDQPVFDDPLVEFHERPNDHMTWQWFMRVWIMFCVGSGNGDFLIDQVSPFSGLPKRYVPLPPGTCRPRRRGSSSYTIDGWDIWNPVTGRNEFVAPDRIVRMQHSPTTDPHVGIGPVQVSRLAATTDNNAAQYNARALENGATPPGILKMKGVNFIPPETRAMVKAEWHETVGGPQNAGRIALLSGDMDFEALGLSPKDMEYINARKWGKEEISTYMDVPLAYVNASEPHGLGDAGMRVEERRLYQTNAGPLLGQAEAALNVPIKRFSNGRLYGRFNLKVIEALQPQQSEKIDQAVKLLSTGQFTRNEVNDRFELDFEENEEWGNEALAPSGLVTTRSIVEGGGMAELLGGLLGGGGAAGQPPGGGGLLPPPGDDIELGGESPKVQLGGPTSDIDLGGNEPDIDLARAWPSGVEQRAALWYRAVARPLEPLFQAALGRIRGHFADQCGNVIKALGRTRGRRRGRELVRWLPGHARVASESIDQAVRAYKVGGLVSAVWPVAERCWIAGFDSAKKDLALARRQAAGRILARAAADDDLAKAIAEAVDKGLISKSQASKITTKAELEAAIVSSPIKATGGQDDGVARLNIPMEYAPLGTQKIVEQYFDPHMQMMTRIDERVRDAISTSLREGWEAGESLAELKDRIRAIRDDVSDKRARTIARTETATFRNGGRFEFMEAQGVTRVQWLSARDDRVRDSHEDIDGDEVEYGEQFRNGLRFPCEVGGPADEVINCRCTLLPIAEGLTDDESDSLAELGLAAAPVPQKREAPAAPRQIEASPELARAFDDALGGA